MHSENMAKFAGNDAKSPQFQSFYMKRMSLTATVTADFRPEVEIMPFLCTCKDKMVVKSFKF